LNNETGKKSIKKGIILIIIGVIISISVLFIYSYYMKNKGTNNSDKVEVRNVNIGCSGLVNPKEGNETGLPEDVWEGSKVYFGNETLWRVLDINSGLIFADGIVATHEFDNSRGEWDENCELKNWLNGKEYKTNEDYFSKIEQTGVKGEISLLSFEETLNRAYGFAGDAKPSGTRAANSWWWLRSLGYYVFRADTVSASGESNDLGGTVYGGTGSVRPILNLNLSQIYLTSAADIDKSDFNLVDSKEVSANQWKLTLQDGDSTFSASLPKEGISGQEITVTVKEKGSGEYTQTSAILTDKNGTVVAYGKIGDAEVGDKTFTLPTTLTSGKYILHIFNEEVNGDYKTDYASKEVTGEIKVEGK